MKTLIRTITVLALINLIATSLLFAETVAVETSPNIERAPVQTTVVSAPQLAQSPYTNSKYGSRTNPSFISTTGNLTFGSRSGNASDVLVIPSAEITTEDVATITEDMNIMSGIFEKSLQQAQIKVNSMFMTGSDPFRMFTLSKPSTQGMYLQGYGALFLMKVDFPLSPGPQDEEKPEEQQEKEEDADPVWTQMKRDMYEPEKSRKEQTKRSENKYDAEKVENLKTAFIKSLKHATNIRSLKPDESVILTITGSHHSSGYKSIRTIPGRNEVIVIDKNNKSQILTGDQVGNVGLSLPTVLVIRAKKSDIDRFAKADLDFDQFKENTQILTSAYLADQSDSGNPFSTIGYYRR